MARRLAQFLLQRVALSALLAKQAKQSSLIPDVRSVAAFHISFLLQSEIKDELASGKCFIQGHDKKGRTIIVLQVRDLHACRMMTFLHTQPSIACRKFT